MNDYNKEYNAKLTTPEKAVKVIKSGDWVDYGCLHAYPALLDRALADRKEELEDVKVRSLLMHGPLHIVEEDPNQEHFTYNSWHMVKFERNLPAISAITKLLSWMFTTPRFGSIVVK